jgi:hypothetical protein
VITDSGKMKTRGPGQSARKLNVLTVRVCNAIVIPL